MSSNPISSPLRALIIGTWFGGAGLVGTAPRASTHLNNSLSIEADGQSIYIKPGFGLPRALTRPRILKRVEQELLRLAGHQPRAEVAEEEKSKPVSVSSSPAGTSRRGGRAPRRPPAGRSGLPRTGGP